MPPGGTKPEKQSTAWPEATQGEIRTASLALLLRLPACVRRTNPCSRQQQQFSELRQSKAALWLPDMQRKKQNGLLEGLHALLLMVSTTMSTTSQYLGSHKCSVHTGEPEDRGFYSLTVIFIFKVGCQQWFSVQETCVLSAEKITSSGERNCWAVPMPPLESWALTNNIR